jgi:uncharacterized protein with HEPN domain
MRTFLEFLQDILEAIVEIESFVDGVDFSGFEASREKILAVVKLLEIIGEATKKIPEAQRLRYPRIAWKSVAGMRDILVHEYWGIDVSVIWATVQDFLPSLKQAITEMISETESEAN